MSFTNSHLVIKSLSIPVPTCTESLQVILFITIFACQTVSLPNGSNCHFPHAKMPKRHDSITKLLRSLDISDLSEKEQSIVLSGLKK